MVLAVRLIETIFGATQKEVEIRGLEWGLRRGVEWKVLGLYVGGEGCWHIISVH